MTDELDDDADTPVIDEGLHARALQIDWSPLVKWPPSAVICVNDHTGYRSYAKYDPISERLVARTGCPVCGTHEMRKSTAVETYDIVAGELDARDLDVITPADVGVLDLIILPTDE